MTGDQGEWFSPQEAKAAIEALKPADEARLLSAANTLSAKNGLNDPDGLLREALVRTLAAPATDLAGDQRAPRHQRRWPRNMALVPFLIGVMSSIASSAAKSNKRSPVDRFADVEEGEELDETEQLEAGAAVERVTPERQAAAQEMLNALDELFEGDEEIRLVLLAMADGLQGQDLRDELDLTETEHNTIRKRMLRKSKALADAWRKR